MKISTPFIFLLSISVVCAVDFDYNINLSDLPFNHTENILLQGIVNTTLNVTYGNFTTGPQVINFTSNESLIHINITIPANISLINYTDQIILFRENYSTIMNFNYYLFNDTILPGTEYILVDINEYKYTVCDYSLPWNTTLENIKIRGRAGDEIYTSFNQKYFNMTKRFVIPSQNYSMIDIFMKLDKDTSIGTFTERVRFSIVSDLSNITFHFEIMDCAIPITVCDDIYVEMLEACSIANMSSEQYVECKRLEVGYESCYYEAVADAAKIEVINNTVIEYVNYTERVPVLDLKNRDVIDTLQELPATIKQMLNENRNKDKQLKEKDATITSKNNRINELVNEKSKLTSDIDVKIETALRPLVEENRLQQNTIASYELDYVKKSKLWWWFFLFLFIGAMGYLGYKYNENFQW